MKNKTTRGQRWPFDSREIFENLKIIGGGGGLLNLNLWTRCKVPHHENPFPLPWRCSGVPDQNPPIDHNQEPTTSCSGGQNHPSLFYRNVLVPLKVLVSLTKHMYLVTAFTPPPWKIFYLWKTFVNFGEKNYSNWDFFSKILVKFVDFNNSLTFW
jgi:hypothetical protein